MKLLLDHCVPRRVARLLTAHEVRTADDMGWQRLRNGDLLRQAATQFDALLTMDRNLKHQQNLAALPIAVVVLVAKSNRLSDIVPLIPDLTAALARLAPKTLIEVTENP